MKTSKITAMMAALLVFATMVASRAGEVAKPGNYPAKAIHWIVPAPAGAALDIPTRTVANLLDLGASVVVENIPGGSQTIGTAEAAGRKADGYTWLTMGNASSLTQPLMNEVSYDIADLRHLAFVTPHVKAAVCVRADSPIKTVKDMLDLFASDRRYSYGIPNAGGFTHLAMANVLLQLGFFDKPNGILVPYTGTSELLTATLGGEVTFGILETVDAQPRVKSGELRAIAVLNDERCHLLPEVDLISDYGVKGMSTFVGFKLFSIRRDTPPEIAAWIKQEVDKVLASDKYQEFLVRMGFGAMATQSEEEINALVQTAISEYAKVMKACDLMD